MTAKLEGGEGKKAKVERGGMNNEGRLHSAHSVFREAERGAVMRSAIWKSPNSAPRATDKDVLVSSQDRTRVFLLICEPDRGI